MTNSIDISVERADGRNRRIIVQAEWDDPKGYGIEHCNSFTTWLSVDIQDGFMVFSKNKTYWKYEGSLSDEEQQQIAEFIIGYKSSDWEP